MATSSTRSLSRDELLSLAAEMGAQTEQPRTIALSGELGTGKTTFVQAFCRGYGVTDVVTSPTYALVHEYEGTRGRVYHLDLYRLAGPADLTNIGWDDILSSGGVLLVEWSERAGDRLPDDALQLYFEHDPADSARRRVSSARRR